MLRAAVAALVLFALPASSARPVARPERGSLDDRSVTNDSVGVLVRFLGVSKEEAQSGIDALEKQSRAKLGTLRVGFVKTKAASLAVVYSTSGLKLSLERFKELAASCSKLKGARAAYVFLHPGPLHQDLEVEGYWTYENGQLVSERRLSFRDDESYLQWVRKRLTTAELNVKKWASWPLSELTLAVGLPGRDFLERPYGVLELATSGFPRDVGENLVLTVVYLPEATLLEIRQLAEKENASPSKVVQDALVLADGEQKLGAQVPTSGRAPWDEEMPQAEKAVLRRLEVFLTSEVFDKLDARVVDETVTLSKIVEYAWRQAHPFAKVTAKP
jgi:hypothetical protein